MTEVRLITKEELEKIRKEVDDNPYPSAPPLDREYWSVARIVASLEAAYGDGPPPKGRIVRKTTRMVEAAIDERSIMNKMVEKTILVPEPTKFKPDTAYIPLEVGAVSMFRMYSESRELPLFGFFRARVVSINAAGEIILEVVS